MSILYQPNRKRNKKNPRHIFWGAFFYGAIVVSVSFPVFSGAGGCPDTHPDRSSVCPELQPCWRWRVNSFHSCTYAEFNGDIEPFCVCIMRTLRYWNKQVMVNHGCHVIISRYILIKSISIGRSLSFSTGNELLSQLMHFSYFCLSRQILMWH